MSGSTRTVTVNIVGDSTNLNRAMTGAGDAAEGAGSRIGRAFKGAFSNIASSAGGAFGPVQELFDGLGPAIDALSEKGASLGQTMIGVGTGVAGAGVALSAFGSKDQASTQQLAQAIKNTGGTYDDYKSKIDATVGSMAKYGYQSNETENALAALTTATHSPSKALGLMGTAANLAAQKHESLSTAANQLIQIVAGKGIKTLTSLGMTEEQAKASATDHAAALAYVAKVTNGQASAASDTLQGKMKALRAEIENHVAELGQKYGPALTGIGVAMSGVGAGVETVSAIMAKFKPAEDAATAAAAAQSAADAAEATGDAAVAAGTAAEAAADTALIPEEAATLGPILLIVAALAGLGAGIYELVTHWSTCWSAIKAVVLDAWHFIDGDFIHPIESFFEGIPGFVEAHWKLILAIITGPIGAAVVFITTHFNQILSFLAGIPSDIATVSKNIGKGLANGVLWGINAIISGWDALVKLLKIPGFSVGPVHFGGIDLGSHLQIGHVPYLANGGIAMGPTLAMIGEAGPEAVVPLSGANAPDLGGSGIGDVYLDGQKVGYAVARHVRSALLSGVKRGATKVGLA